jgi:mannose/fructose/N-acetylgalactosamine-specific phosphotransferase system component IIC
MEQDHSPVSHISFLQRSIFVSAKTANIAAWLALASALTAIANLLNFPLQQIPIPENKDAGIGEAEMRQMLRGFIYLVAIIAVAISLVTFFFLTRFSSKVKKGVSNNQPTTISEGLRSLGSYFKIWGILMMLAMIFFVLSALGLLLRG